MKRKQLSAGRMIALGFIALILTGTALLCLPFAQTGSQPVTALDALFTATSAACVTGLVTVDTGTAWTLFGKTVILLLIQIGGLGVAAFGVSVTLLSGRGLGMKDRQLIKEGWNVSGYGEASRLLGKVLLITLCFELGGAVLSWLVFRRDYPGWQAVGMGVFHAVSAFNNAGFDVLGGMRSLTVFGDRAAINLLTALLIVGGGLGYLAILDILRNRRFRRLTLQTKVVLLTTAALLLGGTLLLKLTEDISWMGAFFQSVSTRTAGFNTWDLTAFRPGGLLVMCILMFIGASPGSTGGGVKTTTLFALGLSARATATEKPPQIFRRKVPAQVIAKAQTVVVLAFSMLLLSTLLLCICEPERGFMELLFEAVSAFATVGLSIASTPTLGLGAKLVLIVTMFVGRIGPLTVATMWTYQSRASWTYSEEGFTIG